MSIHRIYVFIIKLKIDIPSCIRQVKDEINNQQLSVNDAQILQFRRIFQYRSRCAYGD
jgi:hypothetical protein